MNLDAFYYQDTTDNPVLNTYIVTWERRLIFKKVESLFTLAAERIPRSAHIKLSLMGYWKILQYVSITLCLNDILTIL